MSRTEHATPPTLDDPILAHLYEAYVQSDSTPAHLVSSHWQSLKESTSVTVAADGSLCLSGHGFGSVNGLRSAAKVLSSATVLAYLLTLRERRELLARMKGARLLANRMGLFFSYDLFRQVCTLALLDRHWTSGPVSCVLIGDGYGFLGGLVAETRPGSLVVFVDLGRTLFFQAYGNLAAHPTALHAEPGAPTWKTAGDATRFVYCSAERAAEVEGIGADWAISVAAMQEMNEATVAGYFGVLRRTLAEHNLFYCCSREEKTLVGGEISRFDDYAWRDEDEILIDGECPWHRFFLSPGRSGRPLRVARVPVPMVRQFDGPMLHRLVILSADRVE